MRRRSLGGAIFDVVADATAFGDRHRSALVIGAAAAPSTWDTLDPHWAPLESHHRRLRQFREPADDGLVEQLEKLCLTP